MSQTTWSVVWRTGQAQPLTSNTESRSSLRTMISALKSKPSVWVEKMGVSGTAKVQGTTGRTWPRAALLVAERPQFASSPRFELIRVCHGGELPAAQVSRQNLLGNGGLRDPSHRRLDAETLR